MINLVKFRYRDHPQYLVPFMDRMKDCLKINDYKNGSNALRNHTKVAALLGGSEPISESDCSFFLRYLKIERFSSWIIYRVLEVYMLQPKFERVGKEFLMKHLNEKANKQIKSRERCYQQTKYMEIEIDPRHWFGLNGESTSLWIQGDLQEEPSIPPLLLEALWDRVQSLYNSCDIPVLVKMTSKAEAEIPDSFVRKLAERVTNGRMLAYQGSGVDLSEIQKPEYARNI